jgi:hypothetical protein
LLAGLALAACDAAAPRLSPLAAQTALTDADFAALVARVSEEGGYFDTDNLISNESGYLKVVDALERLGLRGGAYVGVGTDQNYSYIAAIRPDIAFIIDVRRDNLLHHLLLKALAERSETRVEFLAALHGVEAPQSPAEWTVREVGDVVAWIDGARRLTDGGASLQDDVAAAIDDFGVSLTEADHATIRRFHRTFIDAGMSLRFTSFGRAPRPYYPTYRQLVLETDIDGDRASYLATEEAYHVVRALHLANRIVPVVGDMSGPKALREIGVVLGELDLRLTAFYASNVEFYLWQAGTFGRWVDNLAAVPGHDGAVVIRSYFPNAGRDHPSSLPGYHSTQSLQPVAALLDGRFGSYWEVVTRGIVGLRD